jgi:hypothetical protein
MKYNFDYYYNNVPGKGLCRNNLIYTSLINQDKTVFCKWYYNDSEYHKGHNEVVDPILMDEKWNRELKFLTLMSTNFPDHVPEIVDIDYQRKKIFLRIEGVDFWQQCFDKNTTFHHLLPDWESQILNIIESQINLGFYKYSVHPSSYFLVDGKLKSINYFFCYDKQESGFCLNDVSSHISKDRLGSSQKMLNQYGIKPDTVLTLDKIQYFILESFKKDYPDGFIKKVQNLYMEKFTNV